MVMDQLDLIKHQTKAALRNKASGAAANFRKQTSLVQQAGRLTGRLDRELKKAEQTIVGTPKTGGHRVERQTAAEKPRPVKPAPDGYVRRSQVQSIRVPENYHRQIVRRILGGTVAVICVLVLIWLLLRSKLLTY